jgi:hypothetical protein
MRVFQDGREFYSEEPTADGEPRGPIFRASIRVTDYDMSAAKAARVEFLAWAAANGIIPEWS